ncbi:MAG: lysostaphin resistance A-like protein [Planctomycetaceae bacterium]
MAESLHVGNLAAWLVVIALGGGSITVWGCVAARWVRGLPALDWEPREPCPWHPAAVAFAFPASIFVHLVVRGAGAQSGGADIDLVYAATLAMFGEWSALVGLLALGGPLRLADFGVNLQRLPGDIAVGVGGFLAACGPVMAVSALVEWLGWRGEGAKHPFLKILDASPGPETVAWIAVCVVVLAPLTEELLYRVILQGWLESRMSPRAALCFVALIFSTVHSQDGRPDALPLLPLALILGYVYQRRHSYPAVVVLHALFNAVNLALALSQAPLAGTP